MKKIFSLIVFLTIIFLAVVKTQISFVGSASGTAPVLTSLTASSNEIPTTIAKFGDPTTIFGTFSYDSGVKIVCGTQSGTSDVCSTSSTCSPGPGCSTVSCNGWTSSGSPGGSFPYNDNSRHFIYCHLTDSSGGNPSNEMITYMDADNAPPTTILYKICDTNNNCGTEARVNNFTLYLYCNDTGNYGSTGSGCSSTSPRYCTTNNLTTGTLPSTCTPTNIGSQVTSFCSSKCYIYYYSVDNFGFSETPKSAIFGPDVGADYDFKTWIGISSTGYPVGKKLTDYVYVRNIGKITDSYTVKIENVVDGLTAKVLNNITDLSPGKTPSFSVLEFTPFGITGRTSVITITITSRHDPTNQKTVTFLLLSGRTP